MANERSWTVVQFASDNTVEAVPTLWIQGDICYWPSMASAKLITSIKKCEPPNTCWPSFKIKVFRNATFDDYIKARNKTKDAEQMSDLASEVETENKRKRIRKVLSSSGSSSDESILPSPPKRCMLKKVGISSNDHLDKESTISIAPLQEQINLPQISQNNNEYCCQGCKENVSKLKVIMEQNHLIRSISTEILSALKEKNDTNKKSHLSIYTDFNINFPINCSAELEKLEEILKHEDTFDAGVIELARLGGANNYNFVKRVMTSLLTNEEASKFSWLGRKGKRPFHNLLMAKLVLNAAEKAHKAKDQKETEMSIQSWLKRARERRQQQSTSKKF